MGGARPWNGLRGAYSAVQASEMVAKRGFLKPAREMRPMFHVEHGLKRRFWVLDRLWRRSRLVVSGFAATVFARRTLLGEGGRREQEARSPASGSILGWGHAKRPMVARPGPGSREQGRTSITGLPGQHGRSPGRPKPRALCVEGLDPPTPDRDSHGVSSAVAQPDCGSSPSNPCSTWNLVSSTCIEARAGGGSVPVMKTWAFDASRRSSTRC